MIKLRLHGERAEIERLEEIICNCGIFRACKISDHYKDRGASVYERVYMDIEVNDHAAAARSELTIATKAGKA